MKTKHKWNFNISENEKDNLADLAEDVDNQTLNLRGHNMLSQENKATTFSRPSKDKPKTSTYTEGKSMMKTLMENLPRRSEMDLREKQLDKRRTTADKIHGASRLKEEGLDGLDNHSEDFLLGNTNSDLQRLLEKEQKQKERQMQDLDNRKQVLLDKQKEKDNAFFKALNIDRRVGVDRITIAPRDD